jgi:hypothetical protein
MRHSCDLLAEELLRWPETSMRPMFGLRAFYRKGAVFALLPDKRALESPSAIGYKLSKKWRAFELQDRQSITAALERLDQAYRKAHP